MNTNILFLGGFETSATALSFITYALGKHPDVQEKVRQEVKEALNEGVQRGERRPYPEVGFPAFRNGTPKLRGNQACLCRARLHCCQDDGALLLGTRRITEGK
ncbi:cytochrome P450, putative [Ixodes scapularis]|uniref:Cytochrome P450, putative n=1 Tax=Ixodes scapularis TaxID=6945 RepID=B7QEH8_IXOSC|nr:cytochrome P450, putative [Ixodes scapularis]|eukprot:XP_002413942.1 cytochrome P450, putative [Ixodes scapularis]